MTKSKYEELQELIATYGEQTGEFYKQVKATAPKIVEAYRAFLGGPDTSAITVPPDGDFDVRRVYRDAAFDSFERRTIYLDPIRMGLCTQIGNREDRGATWVRTVIEFHPSNGGIRATIGNRGRQFHLGDETEGVMGDICEAIFQDVREAFAMELEQAQGRSRIGFITDQR